MQGTVTKFGQSKAGKPTIYIDDKLYFVGKCDVGGLQVGDRISFEGHAFSDDGKLWGLDKWGKLPSGNGEFHAAGRAHADRVLGIAPTTPTGSLDEPDRIPPEHLPCISNVTHAAVTSGLVKDWADLGMCIRTIANALRSQS